MSTPPPFVHLHVWSEYSLHASLVALPALIDAVRARGMGAVALTDRRQLHAALEFYRLARDADLYPVLGLEADVAPLASDLDPTPAPVVLLAENEAGFGHLVRLATAFQTSPFEQSARGLPAEQLAAGRDGVLLLTGGPQGEASRAAAAGRPDGARRIVNAWVERFGADRVFVELQDHGLPSEAAANAVLREIARRDGRTLVVTNGVRYLDRAQVPAADLWRALAPEGSPPPPLPETGEAWLKSPARMAERFPEDTDALAATLDVARRCFFELKLDRPLHPPPFPLPARPAELGAGETPADAFLRAAAEEGLRRRPGGAAAAPRDRLRHELEILRQAGLSDYLLILWDLAGEARRRGIPLGPGRGAGLGSLAAYAIGLTEIDPLAHGLIFERFINPERLTPPEFELEVCAARRPELLAYLRDRYGADRLAHLAQFASLGARTAVREVGRHIGAGEAEVEQALAIGPQEPRPAAAASSEPPAALDGIPRMLALASELESRPHRVGLHGSGLILADRTLDGWVPLMRGHDGALMAQYPATETPRLGLLRLDVAGLRPLTALAAAEDAARSPTGESAASPDERDAAVRDLLRRGATVGIPGLESAGMGELLRRLRPVSPDELSVAFALFRPGMSATAETYLQRRAGREPFEIEPRRLTDSLAWTYGLYLFHEQIVQAAHELAGLPLGRAELLRRALAQGAGAGAWRREVTAGAHRHRVGTDVLDRWWEAVTRAAPLTGSRARMFSQALMAWRALDCKARHPGPYFAALLSVEGAEAASRRRAEWLAEAAACRLAIRAPDLNQSGATFEFDPRARSLCIGLSGVRLLGADAVDALVSERQRAGPYRGLTDCVRRLGPRALSRRAWENLVAAGAFDFTGISRARLTAGLDRLLASSSRGARGDTAEQSWLFQAPESSMLAGDTEDGFPPVAEWSADEREQRAIRAVEYPV